MGKPLSYIGFGGKGKQARDMLHPSDVFKMIKMQMESPKRSASRIINLGGGKENTYSLAQLDAYCKTTINAEKQITEIAENRSFDIPLYITDYSLATREWGWRPALSSQDILSEILQYGKENIEHLKRIS